MKQWFKKQWQQFSTARVALAVALMLIVMNNIKLPPDVIPVIHYPNLDAIATTTPYAILVRDENPSKHVLTHEKCHVIQSNHYGALWVVVINHYYLEKYGYLDNPLEVQARKLSGICSTLKTK